MDQPMIREHDMRPDAPFNPLDKQNLGESVADALLSSPIHPLPPGGTFEGAGIYAIYYSGNFPPYALHAAANRNNEGAYPIYIGKAVPIGARKGEYGLGEPPGPALAKRLREHAQSIEQATNLDLADFTCRYLIVDDIWIPLGESLLVGKFTPVWNQVVDGFGNHDPGKGRFSLGCTASWTVMGIPFTAVWTER